MKVLISGGLGYIGSHTVIEMLKKNYEVVVIDDLSNSKKSILKKIELITNKVVNFYKIDATKITNLELVFKDNQFDSIIHFAGYKSVNESIENPLKYYSNNLISTINLLKFAIKNNIKKFVFSSSATVYGDGIPPFKEEDKLLERTNPYGESKAMSEKILIDSSKAYKNLSVTILRYFNPIGAHQSGFIGETYNGYPNNLMPYILEVAKGIREKLYIFGNDYETRDGTGIRDFIHVVDLARGHIKALENMKNDLNIYNLGTGIGTTVLELVNSFMKTNNIKIPYEITSRREGDIGKIFADPSKALKELYWKPEYKIDDMVRDSWNYEIRNSKEKND